MRNRIASSCVALCLALGGPVFAADGGVSYSQSTAEIDAYDFVEVTVAVENPSVKNPFGDAAVTGSFRREGSEPVSVEGFCDAADGSTYRIRFLPTRPGRHDYQVTFRQHGVEATHEGSFTARDGGRKGLVRVDPEHPWHFRWAGTGEHYFWNGMTTYWLLGWNDESVIERSIDRLAGHKVNRLRVALAGRTTGGERWDENLVANTPEFRFRLEPWVAARPDDVENPGYDVTRFNVPFWQRCERMLRHAREKDVTVSIIFYLDGADPGVDPFGKRHPGSDAERAYYRYAVARLAAFSNVTWDITNEYHLFRDEAWVEKTGALLEEVDPYDHLTSVHGHGKFPFRTSPWCDFAMYQQWDASGGHDFMLEQRRLQAATGRPMPQVNEEYGYEDHYPTRWGGGVKAPARSADNRRRLAWGMCMAGGYQTGGERADRGTGKGADAGGGWLTGRGDDEMIMPAVFSHLVDCFTSFEWWKTEPRDELVTDGSYCLAEPGRQYLAYLPNGGGTTVSLDGGAYAAHWFDPRTGRTEDLGLVRGPTWGTPTKPDGEDWAIVLKRADLE